MKIELITIKEFIEQAECYFQELYGRITAECTR